MMKALVALTLVAFSVSVFADDVLNPIQTQCSGPQGTLLLQTDPGSHSALFKLTQNGHVLQENTKFNPNPGFQGEFSVTTVPANQYVGNWLSVKSVVDKKIFVPAHVQCLPSRSPIPCYSKVNVPDHYEWQKAYGIQADFEAKPNGPYTVQMILLPGVDQKGLVPIGTPNSCVVKGL